jgi:hypothetical protein
MRKKRVLFQWILLFGLYVYALVYTLYVWLHRKPGSTLMMNLEKK